MKLHYDWSEIKKYYEEGHSTKECLKHFSVSNSSFQKAVKRGDIKTRDRLEALKLHLITHGRKKHTMETKEKISKIRKEFLTKNPDKVPYKLNHSSKESYPEKLFRQQLEKNILENVIWVQEYQNGRFSYDFALPEYKIDIEIDGQTHNLEKVKKIDIERDKWSNDQGWIVVRFSAEQVKKEIQSCLDTTKKMISNRKEDPTFVVTQCCYEQLQIRPKSELSLRQTKSQTLQPKKHKNDKKCMVCQAVCHGKLCAKCHRLSTFNVRKFLVDDKETLEKLVWKMSTIQLAKLYGVSDSCISKRCRLLGVKKPPRGFWNRIYADSKNTVGIDTIMSGYEETIKKVFDILRQKGETEGGIALFFMNADIFGKNVLDACHAKEYDNIVHVARTWNEQGPA